MKGFIYLCTLCLVIVSCGDVKDEGADIAPGIGARAILGVYSATDNEITLMNEVCDALMEKDTSFGVYKGSIFNYSSTITENGCSSGADNLSHSIKLQLTHSNSNGFEFVDKTTWSSDPADKNAHLRFEFESIEQGAMAFNSICAHIESGEKDRVVSVGQSLRYTFNVLKRESNVAEVSVYLAKASEDWYNSKLSKIKLFTQSDIGDIRGLITEHEITSSCGSSSERKFFTSKATFTGIE